MKTGTETSAVEPVSRRERKKQETGIRIKKAATKLFKKHGFENVTIAQISKAADIDVTTFWRHYRSKFDILCSDQEIWARQFRATFSQISEEKSIVDAAFEALVTTPPVGESELVDIRYQLSQGTPSLETRSALRVVEDNIRNELAIAIAERLNVKISEDPRPHVLSGAIAGTAHWYSERGWGDPEASLPGINIETVVAELVTAFRTAVSS